MRFIILALTVCALGASGIRERAAELWPDNYEMQEYEVRQKTAAYNRLQTSPRAFRFVAKVAAEDWPDNPGQPPLAPDEIL